MVKCSLLYSRWGLIGRQWPILWAICLLVLGVVPAFAQSFEAIRIGSQTYSNIVIQSRTASHVFFNHSQGFAAIKVADLPVVLLQKLGYAPETEAPQKQEEHPLGPIKINPEVLQKTVALTQPFQDRVLPVLMKMLWLIVAITAFAYLVSSFCFMLICQKAGTPAGLLAWLPVLQMIPLLKAAKMSGGYVLLLLVPVLNLVVALVWCFKLCQVLQKPAWLGLFLFLPATGLFVLLYLAFSAGPNSEEDAPVIKLDFAQNTSE